MSNTEARANDPDLRLLKMCQELTDKVTALEEERKSLSNQNVQLAFKVGDLERDTLLADKTRLREELTAGEARAQEAAERARTIEEESQKALSDKVHQLQDEMKRELEAQAERLGSELAQNKSSLNAELEAALEKARGLTATLEEREAEIGRLKGRSDELQADLGRHEERARKEYERAESLENELASVRAEREAEGAALRTKLEEREKEVAELEATVRAFKEQFLEKAQTSLSPGRKRKAAADGARPREVLRYLAEETLGSTGRILVDSIFTRLGHDPDTTDGGQLREVVEQLLDYSGSLATPEQYESLKAAMDRFEGYLERPEESVELLPGTSTHEEDDEELEEPVPAPVASVPPAAPAAPPPPAQEPEPAPAPAAAAAPEPEPVTSAAVDDEPPAPAECPPGALEAATDHVGVDAGDDEQLPLPPAEEGAVAEPELVEGEAEELVRLEDEEQPGDLPALIRATDPALLARIEEGMKLLGLEKFEQSLDLFVALHAEHPNCLEVQMGMFYNYVGFDCYMEAYEFGLRLMPVLLAGEGRDRFVTAMSSVLKMRLEQTRNLAEKKAWLLQLAELHLDKPQMALKYLRQAQRMPDEIPGDGRISFYLTRLLADTREERMPYLHTYMSRVADSREIFRHIHEIYSVPKHRAMHPAMELVLTLGRGGRTDAQALQEQNPNLRVPLEPGLLEQSGTVSERALLELMLDKLVPAARLSLDFPSPRQEERISKSKPAPASWRPAALAEELRTSLFGSKGTVKVVRYEGPEDFLTDLSPAEDEWTLLLHPRAEELPDDDLKFYILRRYFQAQRRHLHLYRIQEGLTDESRRALLRKILDGGPDISHSLQREADKLLDQSGEITVGQWRSLLDRLYTHARHEDFRLLFRLFTEDYPFAERLSAAADQFAARVVGLATACYALTRELAPDALARVEKGGLQVLYEPPLKTHRELRLRVQRLWLAALKPA